MNLPRLSATPAWHPKSPTSLIPMLGLAILAGIHSPAASGPRPSPVRASSSDGIWRELPPPARAGHSAIYDSPHQRMLIFGGSSSDQVWALALDPGGAWSRVTASGTAPTGGRAIYDPPRQRMLVCNGAQVYALSLASGPAWSQLPAAGTPPAYAAVLYDPPRDRVLAFTNAGVVWQLTLTDTPTWSAVTVSGTPPGPRSNFALVYDSTRDQALLHGGSVPNGMFPCVPQATSEVWALKLGTSTWQLLATSGSAPAVASQSAIYDPVRDRMVVFGGESYLLIDPPNCVYSPITSSACATLTLSGTPTWGSLGPPGAPISRSGHSAIYDAARDRMVVFGGRHWYVYPSDPPVATCSDAPELSFTVVPSWIYPHPAPRADFVWNARSVYDPVADRLVASGGRISSAGFTPPTTGLTSSYALGTPSGWTELPTGPSGSHGVDYTFVDDAARNRVLVFGGVTCAAPPCTWTNGVDTLGLGGGSWGPLSPLGTPPSPRSGHSAVIDPIRSQMIVFGGLDGGGYLGDVWALSLGAIPTWSQLVPAGPLPPARANHAAIYDALGDRMIVWGGNGTSPSLGDVWALSLGGTPNWTLLLSGAGGPAPGAAQAVYDPYRHRMVVNREWSLALDGSPSWTHLALSGAAPASGSGAFDPVRDRMVVCEDGSGSVWALEWTPTVIGTPFPEAAELRVSGAIPNPSRVGARFEVDLAEPAMVSLRVFDLAGRLMREIADRTLDAGRNTLEWDGRDHLGRPVAPSLYFVRVSAGSLTQVRKLVIAR